MEQLSGLLVALLLPPVSRIKQSDSYVAFEGGMPLIVLISKKQEEVILAIFTCVPVSILLTGKMRRCEAFPIGAYLGVHTVSFAKLSGLINVSRLMVSAQNTYL